MATFDQIKALRLDISDPANYIDILSVINAAALPAAPAQQTAYKVLDTSKYVATDTESGAAATDYESVELQLSDSRISTWLDTNTHDETVVLALKAIIKRLGGQVPLQRTKTGSESVEYTMLLDLYNYYRRLLKDQQNTVDKENNSNTGKWGNLKQPEIAGGNL